MKPECKTLCALSCFLFAILHSPFCLSSDPPAASLPQAMRAGWPQLQCNAARTGWTPDQVDPPYVLAGFHYSNEMVCNSVQPVAVDNTIYYGTVEGTVFAIDLETGSEKWKQKTGGAILGSCAVVDGRVVVPCFDGKLYAFNAADGALEWEFATPWHIWGAPAVANGLIYASGMDGVLYAVNPKDGKQVWACETGAPIAQAPAADKQIVVVGSEDMRVTSADAKTGKLLWRSEPLAGGESFHNVWPVLYAGRIYLTVTPANNRWVCNDPYLSEVVAKTTEALAVADTVNTPLDEWPYIEAARAYFKKYPERRISFVLDAATGEQAYVLPFPWWGGCAGPPSPPAVNERDGWAYLLYALIRPGPVSGTTFLGRIRMETGEITPFNELDGFARRQSARPGMHGGTACQLPVGCENEQDYIRNTDPTWKQKSLFHGGFWAADQSQTVSFGGDKMYLLHDQGGHNLVYYDTATGDHAYINRDSRGRPLSVPSLWGEEQTREYERISMSEVRPYGNQGIYFWAPPSVYDRYILLFYRNMLYVYAGVNPASENAH